MFSYCHSLLLELLLTYPEGGCSFDQLHSSILESFFPGHLWYNLRQERFFKLQRHGEELAHLWAASSCPPKFSKFPMNEKEIVDVISEGITWEAWSLLVFCSKPASYVKLSQMSVTAGAVKYNDNLQGQEQKVSHRILVMLAMEPSQCPSGRGFGSRLCLNYGQPGHISRFCWTREASRPGPSSA